MPTLEFHEKLPTIHQLKSLLVREAMKRSSGNLDHAAGMLGISTQTMMKYVMDEFHRL
ncbi:MAG: helix-turn-helix domain-containing protein [Pseudomonadota bacterium]